MLTRDSFVKENPVKERLIREGKLKLCVGDAKTEYFAP